MALEELVKRHGSHHFLNVKYGYIVLFCIFLHLIYIYLTRMVYLKKWITTGRSTTWRRLILVPDVVVLIIWCIVLLGLGFWHFNPSEISVFIKRLGRLSYSLLPLDIFISLKPNPLPNVYYLKLIFLHKWISRVIVFLAFVHSLMFSITWIKANTFTKIFKVLNFLGVLSVSLFLLSTIVSLKPIRRRFYKFFFTTHLLIAWACVILLQFHARPGVTLYTFINVILFILQILVKFFKSTDVVIDKKTSSGSALEVITIPNFIQSIYPAGSHIRLSYSKLNPLTYILPSHPYTISSLPEENTIKLVVRKTKYELKAGQRVSCFGPFPSIHQNFFRTAENVILVAGGSGISYALGLYQQLSSNSSINVLMIWILRTKSDLWILDHFKVRNIDVFLTGGAISADDEPLSRLFDDEAEELLDGRDSFEMNHLDPFDDVHELADKPERSVKFGRPDFAQYSPLVSRADKANSWIISCGTASLNRDCRKWAEGLNVRFHSEIYEL